MTLKNRIGERDELTIVLRLYHDLRDGLRSDEATGVRYAAKLLGATPEAIQDSMAVFARLDPRRGPPGDHAAAPSELVFLWRELGAARARARKQAKNSEAVFWKRYGARRMSFDDWKAEVRRIWHHEGGGRRLTATAEQIRAAFDAGTAPWQYYASEMAFCQASVDDIPVLGDEDDASEE
jgi:hypothetical protein